MVKKNIFHNFFFFLIGIIIITSAFKLDEISNTE